MESLNFSYLANFWSPRMLEVNLLVFLNLAGALALGLLVGYERSYHGRAAGIVTGVGFLGAGVIMKEGLNISGLTTAASIWASSAIGIMVGIGFFGAAILLALLSAALMMWGPKLESRLPSRRALGVSLVFTPAFNPDETSVKQTMREWGYMVAEGSLNISADQHTVTWTFVMVALVSKPQAYSLFDLSRKLRELAGVDSLQISHARN